MELENSSQSASFFGYEVKNSLQNHLTTNFARDHLPSQATHSGKYLTTNGTVSSWNTLIIDIANVSKAQKNVQIVSGTDTAVNLYCFKFPNAGLYLVKGTISSTNTVVPKYLIYEAVISVSGGVASVLSTIRKTMYTATDFTIDCLADELHFHVDKHPSQTTNYIFDMRVSNLNTITIDSSFTAHPPSQAWNVGDTDLVLWVNELSLNSVSGIGTNITSWVDQATLAPNLTFTPVGTTPTESVLQGLKCMLTPASGNGAVNAGGWNNALANQAHWTMFLVFKLGNNVQSQQMIIGKGNNGFADDEFYYYVNANQGANMVSWTNSGTHRESPTTFVPQSTAPVTVFAFTTSINGGTDLHNGFFKCENGTTTSFLVNTNMAMNFSPTISGLTIGGYGGGGGGLQFTPNSMKIGEVAIMNRALTTAEITTKINILKAKWNA